LALATQVVFEGSYGYRAEDKATILNVSACDSTVAIPGCFYYRFFEANPELGSDIFDRNAHELGTNLARALTDSILVGLNFKYYDYDSELMDEGGDTSGFTLDAGAIVRPTSILQLGVVGYNLVPQDTPQYPTAIGAGAAVRPTPAIRLAGDGLWDLDDDRELGKTGRYGLGGEYFFTAADKQSGYPLRVGYVYDRPLESSYITAGLGLLNTKVGIDIGLRRQISGDGDELMIQAGLRLFGPTVR
jgi:hypothetical protein